MMMWTTPCKRVALPIASVKAPIKNDKYINVILRLLIPRLRCRSKKIAIAATVGMVKPMLAKAEPSAKFKLLCKRLAFAALTAAKPSGNKTKRAMAIPTMVFGTPAAATPLSIAGLSSSARPTTKVSERMSSRLLTVVLRLLGFCAWTLLSIFLSSVFGS